MGEGESVARTVARLRRRAASRTALHGLHTSSSSSALEWFLWYSFRGFISPQFLHAHPSHDPHLQPSVLASPALTRRRSNLMRLFQSPHRMVAGSVPGPQS